MKKRKRESNAEATEKLDAVSILEKYSNKKKLASIIQKFDLPVVRMNIK